MAIYELDQADGTEAEPVGLDGDRNDVPSEQ